MDAEERPGESVDARPRSAPAAQPRARVGAAGAALARLFASAAWLRAAREIAIVTLGILIAFALNAWWEERRERRQEQHHLRALASDFQQNAKQLAFLVGREDEVARYSMQLLQTARAAAPASPETVRPLVQQVFSSQRFEPVMGGYEALVNSAGLTLIRDDALRAALADFAALVSGRYAERFADQLYLQFIDAFAGRLQFAAIVASPDAAPTSYAELLEDRRFQEYLAWRYAMERQVSDHYRDLQARAESILAQLQDDMR